MVSLCLMKQRERKARIMQQTQRQRMLTVEEMQQLRQQLPQFFQLRPQYQEPWQEQSANVLIVKDILNTYMPVQRFDSIPQTYNQTK